MAFGIKRQSIICRFRIICWNTQSLSNPCIVLAERYYLTAIATQNAAVDPHRAHKFEDYVASLPPWVVATSYLTAAATRFLSSSQAQILNYSTPAPTFYLAGASVPEERSMSTKGSARSFEPRELK